MRAGLSPDQWLGRPVSVQLAREPERERTPRDPSAGLHVRGWL
jgi:hypothetical protein